MNSLFRRTKIELCSYLVQWRQYAFCKLLISRHFAFIQASTTVKLYAMIQNVMWIIFIISSNVIKMRFHKKIQQKRLFIALRSWLAIFFRRNSIFRTNFFTFRYIRKFTHLHLKWSDLEGVNKKLNCIH